MAAKHMRSAAGFTLLEIMISLGIFAFIALIAWQTISSYNKVQTETIIDSQRLAIRSNIAGRIDCIATNNAKIGAPANYSFDANNDCGNFSKGQAASQQVASANGKYFKLKDKNGEDLALYTAGSDSGRTGYWLIRTSCTKNYVSTVSNVSSLVIFGVPANSSGQPLLNPLTGRSFNWEPIFEEGLCARQTQGQAVPLFNCANAGGKSVASNCYFAGGENQSCTSVCTSKGLIYDDVGTNYISATGGGGTTACMNALDQLGLPSGYAGGSPQHKRYETRIYGSYNPFAGGKYFKGVFGIGKGRWILDTANNGDGGGTWKYVRRVCACK